MRSFWSDPYLWIHLAGLSAFPLFVEGCLIGFAWGEPFLPVWLELSLVAVAGILPILWMQWQRPFYIFSLVMVCLKPAALTDDQRKLLTLFKSPRTRVLAVLASISLVGVLWQVYALAPIAASSVAFLPPSRLLGLLLAATAFLACNLFVQVPLSVASVMLTGESTFTRTVPYPQEQVRQSFSLLGLQLSQILPPVVAGTKPTIAPQAPTDDISVTTDSIAEAAPTPTEPLTRDLWVDTTAEDSPTDNAQALKIEAVTADLPDEVPEATTVPEETSAPEDISIAGTSIKDTLVEPAPPDAEGDDRVL